MRVSRQNIYISHMECLTQITRQCASILDFLQTIRGCFSEFQLKAVVLCDDRR